MNFGVVATVFKRPPHVMLAVLVATAVFVFAVLLPNFKLITVVFTSQNSTLLEKSSLLLNLLGSIQTNFTTLSAITVFLISILFGIQVSLLVYYIKRVRTGSKISGVGASGLGGLVSGMFGIGCAACGTFVLTSLLALFGVSGLLAFLPFGGEEFGFIGLGLLGYSIYMLIKKINDPLVCSVN